MFDQQQLDTYLTLCNSGAYQTYLNQFYTDIPAQTIQFTDTGSVAEDGSFQIVLSPDSKRYVKSVDFYLIEFAEDDSGADEIRGLGADNDIDKDWDTLTFRSNFRGIWLGLDGNLLSYTVTESNQQRIMFSAPVLANGVKTNLRFSFIWDDSYENGGYYQLIGLWDGVDTDGVASKEITPLKAGDQITILSRQIDASDYMTALTRGETITIGADGGVVSEIPLSQKNYQYVYAVTDIFGQVYYSSTAIFEMQYTYEELLQNPMPDGTYAATVSVISADIDNELAYGGVVTDE